MKRWLFILLMFPTILFAQTSNKCVGETINAWVDTNISWDYKWSVSPSIEFTGQGTPSITIPNIETSINIAITVTNSSGCDMTEWITIRVDECPEATIYFPNALVPDGTNKTWMPKYENIEITSLEIWDRWGRVVWIWKGKDFEGFNEDGSAVDGVFSYVCWYKDLVSGRTNQAIGMVVVVH